MTDLPWSEIWPQVVLNLILIVLFAGTLGEALFIGGWLLGWGAFLVAGGYLLARHWARRQQRQPRPFTFDRFR